MLSVSYEEDKGRVELQTWSRKSIIFVFKQKEGESCWIYDQLLVGAKGLFSSFFLVKVMLALVFL